MKKLMAPLLGIALITACSDQAQDNAAAEPASPAAEAVATATGTIEAVDPAAGTIVIAHGPVEALKWPAMTMGFRATPEQMKAVRPGQKVTFAFHPQGRNYTITRIEPVQ